MNPIFHIEALGDAKAKIDMLGTMFCQMARCEFEPPNILNHGFYEGLEVICAEIENAIDGAVKELASKPKLATAKAEGG